MKQIAPKTKISPKLPPNFDGIFGLSAKLYDYLALDLRCSSRDLLLAKSCNQQIEYLFDEIMLTFGIVDGRNTGFGKPRLDW